MNNDIQREGVRGCVYLILVLLTLAALFLSPAIVGVSELAKRDRIESTQVGEHD